MKKILNALLSLILIVSMIGFIPEKVRGNDYFTSGDFEYYLDGDNNAVISEYTGNASVLIIPSKIDGYLVTSIGANAFWECSSLTSIEIPDSVTSIGDFAFYGCEGLKDNSGFVIIRNVLYGYYGNASNIVIPDNVSRIGYSAFSQCTSLTSIEIPDSVTSIGASAFSHCTSLTSIEIPDSVTSIGDFAFYGCEGLKDNSGFVIIRNVLYGYYGNASNIVIPDCVSCIGNGAFNYCDSLTSIEIPDSVTSIGANAFSHCTSLTSIEIPDSVTSVENYAFEFCTSLTSIKIPNSVTSIGGWAFEYCTSLISIEIPDSVTYIGFEAFYKCANLTILGIKGSYAEIYANENEIPFKEIDEGLYPSLLNKKVLQQKIKEAKSIDVTLYTDESVSELNKAIKIGDTVLKLESATQQQIDETVVLLNEKIKGLKKIKQDNNVNSDYDIESMIGNINEKPFKIEGCYINLLDYKIPLINMEVGCDLPFLNRGNFKLIVDEEEKKLKVVIGCDIASKDAQIGFDEEGHWKESYKQFKDFYKSVTKGSMTNNDLRKQFNKLKKGLKKINAKLIVDVGVECAGYLEFDIANGDPKFIEGGIVASISTDTDIRFPVYGIAYVVGSFQVDIEGTIIYVGEKIMANPQFEISPIFMISGGVGLGVANTYAQAEMYGRLNTTYSTYRDPKFKVVGDVGAKGEVYILGFEVFNGIFPLGKIQLWPKPSNQMCSPIMQIDKQDITNANYISRSYLNSRKLSQCMTSPMGLDAKTKRLELPNSYPLNDVNLVSFDDGTMLLVYLDDDGSKTEENMTSLMYSYYDGNIWNEPVKIHETGTFNDKPYVYSDGKLAYIIWQRANTKFEAGIQLEKMMEEYDLYEVVFDSSNQSLSNILNITNEDETRFEYLPKIYGSNGEFTVAWIEKSENDIFNSTGETNIKTASYDKNGNCLESSTVATVQGNIKELVLNEQGVYYSVYGEECIELYKDGVMLCENVSKIHATENEMMYLTDNTLVVISDEIKAYDKVGCSDQCVIVSNDQYIYLIDEKLNEGYTKKLYISTIDKEKESITQPELFAEDFDYIRSFSGTICDDELIVGVNSIELDEQKSTNKSTIVVTGKTDKIDLSVDMFTYDKGSEEIKITGYLSNNTSFEIDEYRLKLYDVDGNVVFNKTYNESMPSFTEVKKEFVVKNNFDINKGVSMEIEAIDKVDYNLDNNKYEYTSFCFHEFDEEWTINKNRTISRKCENCDDELDVYEIKYIGQDILVADSIAKVNITNYHYKEVYTMNGTKYKRYSKMSFKDVPTSAWFYSSVYSAYTKGLMSNTGKGKDYFEPDAPITRGMVATVLHRMANNPKVTFTPKFPDVKQGVWYTNAIIWASKNNIVSGNKDGSYAPDKEITRQDLAIMLRNYAKSKGINTSKVANLSSFLDEYAIDSYAYSAIAWCVEAKLMSGTNTGVGSKLQPKANASRAECAKMFALLDDLIKS